MGQDITVCIVDDHVIVREGLKKLLEANKEISVVGEAGTAEEALRQVRATNPDILLLDIGIPGRSGIFVLKKMSEESLKTKIIVLSMYTDAEYIQEAIRLGVSGYLVKHSAFDVVISAIQSVMAGQSFFSPEVSSYLKDAIRNHINPVDMGLTKREKEILTLVAEGLTSQNIGDRLYISIKTVNKHRQNIMNKLNIHDIAGLTRYAIENGLISV
ncbi:MAG: response regulator transcription factor [Candidatus Marinimicrobia bacterium]|nr:response regulator transcription factor [Candidatus Neomarinimicrobiota bacterium]